MEMAKDDVQCAGARNNMALANLDATARRCYPRGMPGGKKNVIGQ